MRGARFAMPAPRQRWSRRRLRRWPASCARAAEPRVILTCPTLTWPPRCPRSAPARPPPSSRSACGRPAPRGRSGGPSARLLRPAAERQRAKATARQHTALSLLRAHARRAAPRCLQAITAVSPHCLCAAGYLRQQPLQRDEPAAAPASPSAGAAEDARFARVRAPRQLLPQASLLTCLEAPA